MDTTLRDIGNSKGVVIPVRLINEFGLRVGDKLTISSEGNRLVIEPKDARPKYSLDSLLAKCDASAEMPSELVGWDNSGTVGAEI